MTEDIPVWTRDEIDSPCVRVCVVHPETRICIGCHRTTDEIRLWSKMSPDERRDIMHTLPERAPLLRTRRRGGRAARLKG
jgi:predicted Fe-S protein YdhL (DUF1289 family)